MNPLSPLTYYLRHKRSALLQIALISLATVGLFILVGVLDTIPLRANVSYLTRFSRVIPTGGALDPTVVSQIQTHPDVARVIPDNGLRITLPALIGTDSQRLLGVSPQEAQYLMQHCGVRLKQGRMFEPRSNEFVLSEEIARALDLELGSEIEREIDPDHYRAIPSPLVLVGVLEGASGTSVRLGFVSDEYLDSHELYAPRASSLLLVAKTGRKAAVDDFLETTIRSEYAKVETFDRLVRTADVTRTEVYLIFGIVNSVVAVAVAFVVGVINQIAMTRRLDEFGLLHALGRPKKRLIRRLTLEMAAVAGIGFLMGLATALAILSWLKNGPFYDMGVELNLLNPAPFCFILPIPLVAVALTFWSVRRIFSRLDAVSIVEQGKLSQEQGGRQAVKRSRTRRSRAWRSSARPLSSLTFYLRHRRRGVLMILSTALMVLVTAFPVFFLSAILSASRPESDYLQQVSEIYLLGRSETDPGIVGQIRSHPAVAYTVPAFAMGIQMILPPIAGTEAEVYGVSEADLPILLELYGLQVQQGRMPRPRSNEILISAAVAANRGLRVGDVIGGETDDDAPIVDYLPVEMVVAGVLWPDRPWIGFASYEYLQNHELTSSGNPNLLIIPREGQKQALDNWLEESLDPAQVHVITHAIKEREYKEMMTTILLIFALLEYMIATVAAIALATLNHIFFTQRKQEFGTLNAIGRSRRWLVLRTMKETGGILGIAWVVGAVVCGVGLLAVQNLVYGPRSLTMDLFNLTPWLLTMSLPLTVVLISTGTITWMLSRLDSVSIVERR
jgi:ABC-type antimicrobial peptide transport system permease subunit